jgi:molybdenum cofactor biosynthesis enzyme MoaA
MIMENENQDVYNVFFDIKSEWFDIVYILHHDKRSVLEIITNSKSTTYPLFTGGQRSISFKISKDDIVDGKFKFKLKKPANINLDIKSIINRENFNDFLGLTKYMDDSSYEFLEQTKKTIESTRLTIQWFVTWKCNMACNYCWQESASSIYRTLGNKTVKTAYDWANAFNKLNPGRLYLTGGEPTLYKDLPELVGYLNDDITIDMTSNFGKTFDVNKWKYMDVSKWNVIFFSLHPTQWENPNDFFTKLEKFIEYFDARKVGIEMVLHEDNVKLVDPNKIIEFSKKHNLVDPHLDNFVDSNIKNLNFNQTSLAIDEEIYPNYSDYYRLIEQTENNGRKPIFCPASWKKVNVDFEGNVFTCMSAIDRSKIFHESAMPHYTPIANIFDSNFELKKNPVICWESFRCSACDYQMLQHAWRPIKNNFNYQLPIPE